MQKLLTRRILHSLTTTFRFKSSQKVPAKRQQQESNKLTKLQKQEKELNKPNNEINWERMKESYKSYIMRGQFSLIDLKKNINWNRLLKKDEVLFYFRNIDDLAYWYVNTDEDEQGFSWAELRPSKNDQTALFRGYINNKIPRYMLPSSDPLAKKPLWSGYAYMETKPFRTVLDKESFINLEHFNAFKLRIRGDGRMYKMGLLNCFGMLDQRMFWCPIYTNGGPEWQEVTIPFSKFYQTKKGQKTKRQPLIEDRRIQSIQFNLRDNIEGPFQLEVDYIAMTTEELYKNNHNENHNPWLGTDLMSG